MPAGLISIDIEARLAKLEEGITKANRNLDTFGQHAAKVGSILQGVFAGFVSGISLSAITDATKSIIEQASALADLSQATGSSVEALSRLNNQARISGADFATVESAVLKLSQGMSGVDEASSKTKEALKILGITAKDPAQAVQEIALKLATYADGVNKVGLAQSLFGRGGREFLKTLQDIADLQDVNATVTTKQAAEAEELGKAYRRLGVEAEGFKNIVLSSVVPALTSLIQQFVDAERAAGNFGRGLTAALSVAALSGGTEQKLSEVNAEIVRVTASLKKDFGPLKGLGELNEAIKSEQLTQLEAQKGALEAQLRRQNRTKIDSDVAGVFGPKPGAPNPPAAVAKMKDLTSEAQRYLEALQKQLERTQDLTTVETFLRDIQLGRFKEITHAQKDQILAVAQELDAYKDLIKAVEDGKKVWDDETKAILDNVKAKGDAAAKAQDVAAQAFDSVRTLQDEIAIILGGENARKALAKDYADAAIAKAEQNRLTREGLGANSDELTAIDAEIAALKERRDLLDGKDLAEKLRADADAFKQLADQFDAVGKSSFATLLTDLQSGKGLGTSIKNLGTNLFAGVNKIITDKGLDQLFSQDGPLGGFGGSLATLFGGSGTGAVALTGSATALTGAAAALDIAASALTAAAGAGSASAAANGFSGFGKFFDFGAAAGGEAAIGNLGAGFVVPGFAVGTNFVPRDMIAKIHKGERIVPANENRMGYGRNERTSVTVVQNIQSLANTQTGRQTAKLVGRAAAQARRG